jgi:hypothetical protein
MIVPLLLAGLAVIQAYIGSQRNLSKWKLLFVTAFFSLGAVMVVWPDLANRATAILRVGRGADLLLYFAVLFGVLIAANFYFRFRQNEQVVIAIVRQLALLTPAGHRAVHPEDGSCRKS